MSKPTFFFTIVVYLLTAKFALAADKNYHKTQPATIAPYSQIDLYAANQNNIKKLIRDVAEFQLKEYGDTPGGSWTVGTFFSSFIPAYQITNDDWYLKQATKWGEFTKWDIHHELDADDVCPGQTYLDLYFIVGDKKMISTLDQKLSKRYFNRTTIKSGELREWEKEEKPFIGRNIWSWADALYMAPPVFARLGKATGKQAYYDVLHKLFWDATDYLFDPTERLYFRNSKAETDQLRTPYGKKVFWSRGNGWVFGGLARLIEFLPDNDPYRAKYIKMLQDMAYSLAKYQQADGLWRSALNDPDWYATPETSGSAFFVYGMAKGIRKGWLDKDYFLPTVIKGWSGLAASVTPEGKLGYSQVVAGSPHEVRPRDGVDYAHGAFILAATEIHQLDLEADINKLARDIFKPRLVVKDGSWGNYHDNAVLAHKGVFYANYKKITGQTAITAFTTKIWPNVSAYARKEKILTEQIATSDSHIASLVNLADDKLLALYGSDGSYRRDIALPLWSEMKLSEEAKLSNQHNQGYQSLFKLADENNRLYQFSAGINFQPLISYSDDNGKTWSKAINFLQGSKAENFRPFVRYASNGKNRIDIFLSDSRNHDVSSNTLYHLYYQQGVFYRSNGQKISALNDVANKAIKLKQTSAVLTSQFLWLHDFELVDGQPQAAAIRLNPQGTYEFWLSRYQQGSWQSFKLGQAGSYPKEKGQAYLGSITLHPTKANTVVISSNVHPQSGEVLADSRHQLFKGVLTTDTNNITWQQLTFDPIFDHIRPTISRGSLQGLFWVSGEYNNHLDFQTDILMSEAF